MSANTRILNPTLIVRAENPDAGAEYSFSIPPGKLAQLASIHFKLQAANAGVARAVLLNFERAGTTFATVFPAVTQPINSAMYYSYLIGIGTTNDLNASFFQQYSLPTDLNLQPADEISIQITALDVGDQLSGISIGLNVADFLV